MAIAPRIGVDYFPEHWRRDRWPIDAQMMVDAGMKVVRIAEFTWSKIQPRRGEWDWTWLDSAVQVLAEAGLDIILCTPTACPPPWMAAEDPSILPVMADGSTLGLGSRRHYSPHHDGYRAACVDIARRMAERYGHHERVIAFQIDNELYGALNDCGPLARLAFQRWLAERHGTLGTLDARLGLIFWGQQYAEWTQIPVPTQRDWHPGLRLEWERFASDAWINFCKAQVDVMRPLIGDRLLTTNCYLHRWGMGIDWHQLVKHTGLDRFAFDNYSLSAHENAFYNDMARSITSPYWILEQQCGLPGGQHLWPDDPGRIHHFMEESVRRGAEVVTYFRWRQCRFGQEQDHGAIIDHNGEAGRVYDEVKMSTARLVQEGPFPPPEPRTGIVFSWRDSWALGASPSPIDYSKLVIESVYRACFDRGDPVRFVFEPDQMRDLERIIVPAKVIHDERWEQAIADTVAAGITVVLLPMTFAKDHWNAYRETYQSPRMHELQGARLVRRVPLRRDHVVDGIDRVGVHYGAQLRCEEWLPDAGTQIVARFRAPPLDDCPLVLIKDHGQAKVVTIAGYLTHDGLAQVLGRYC